MEHSKPLGQGSLPSQSVPGRCKVLEVMALKWKCVFSQSPSSLKCIWLDCIKGDKIVTVFFLITPQINTSK